MARNRTHRHRKVLGWHVVETHQHWELDAKRELLNQGFEAALPMMQGEFNSRGVRRPVVLFEGYVFVRETSRWWSIRGTRGVAQLLMGTEGPAVLADDELQFFLSGSVDELGYYVDPVMKRYAIGDEVTPKAGPWSGKLGLLTKLDGAGRCELLYSLLGRPVTVTSQVRELA